MQDQKAKQIPDSTFWASEHYLEETSGATAATAQTNEGNPKSSKRLKKMTGNSSGSPER